MPDGNVWYFTFCQHDTENKRKYVKIKGTYGEAREKMSIMFGLAWAFQYSEEQFAGQVEAYGLTHV